MSMPSSRLDVATIARRWPDFSSDSTCTRCSRERDPWCARTSSSPARSLRRAARRSAMRRALTNTIVVRCARISSRMRGSTYGQMLAFASGPSTPTPAWPIEGSFMSSTGTTTSTSIALREPASTIVTRRAAPSSVCPPRKRAISSSGRCVAERPMRCGGMAVIAPSRSSDNMRCAPRFVGASVWISSTITVCTPRNVSRA